MAPSVSVALCTFNGARFIEEQVASILSQDVPPTELVVSDDGSVDDTLDLIRRAVAGAHSTTELRILPVERRQGVTLNFQRAASACRGDLIALSDQDDVWHADRISAIVPMFERDPELLLVNNDARLIDDAGEQFGNGLFAALGVRRDERALLAGGDGFEVFIRRNLATGAATMFRRELLDLALPFPIEWVHDEWLAILASAMGSVAVSDDQLVDYRQHGGNAIGVTAPTLRYRVSRVFEPRGDRLALLAERSRILMARLEALGAPKDRQLLAARKLAFEQARTALPATRIARVPGILGQLRRGSYAALSSQRSLDVLRDLLQPV